MTNIQDLSPTIAAKSDQLNADDLLGGPITVTIEAVNEGAPDQPVSIKISGGHQPYKPCKSMRRVLIAAWGSDGTQWAGRSMTLFNEPTVLWAGKPVGGIRISALSDMPKEMTIALTVTRGKKAPTKIGVIKAQAKKVEAAQPVDAPYPADQFTEKLPAMLGAISSGKMNVEQVIAQCNKTGTLTEAQVAQLSAESTESTEEVF